jgi:bifunctional non-homologous end joining protein LigD
VGRGGRSSPSHTRSPGARRSVKLAQANRRKGHSRHGPLPKPIVHDEAHRKALRLVRVLAERHPEHYILSAQGSRRGRIFLDYLRNGRGTTAIGALSSVQPGFPIAVPVTWSSIEAGIRPDAFTMKSPFRARSSTANRVVQERA